MKKIVILGADGQLGSFLNKKFNIEGYSVSGYSREQLDITNMSEFEEVISEVDIIINCAAYTNTYKCETDSTCELVNTDAVKQMVHLANKHKVKLVHISTNYVYTPRDSDKEYLEDEFIGAKPIDKYGLTKLKADKYINDHSNDFLVLRVSWLHSAGKQNFITKISTNNQPIVKIATDDIANFTTGSMVKRFLESNIDKTGFFNVCTTEKVSRNELYRKYLKITGNNQEVVNCLAEDFGVDISRLKGLYMSNAKAKKVMDIYPIDEEIKIWLSHEKEV